MTYNSPFQVRIGGNDSAVIGGTGLPYTAANLTAAIVYWKVVGLGTAVIVKVPL